MSDRERFPSEIVVEEGGSWWDGKDADRAAALYETVRYRRAALRSDSPETCPSCGKAWGDPMRCSDWRECKRRSDDCEHEWDTDSGGARYVNCGRWAHEIRPASTGGERDGDSDRRLMDQLSQEVQELILRTGCVLTHHVVLDKLRAALPEGAIPVEVVEIDDSADDKIRVVLAVDHEHAESIELDAYLVKRNGGEHGGTSADD